MDSYLLVDREAENSVKYFALQLFTVPSIAAFLVERHDIINRLHNLIIAFFTEQIHDKVIQSGPGLGLGLGGEGRAVNVDSAPFKSKRFMPMFSDLRYICSNASVQRLIATSSSSSSPTSSPSSDYLASFLGTCRLFMGANPNKRQAHAHVEYEQEAWISVFNVTLSLSRVVKVFAEAFREADPRGLVAAILRVARDIVQTCALEQPGLDRGKYGPIVWTTAQLGKHEQEGRNLVKVIDFDVLSGWVSFHHSEHWLLAELMKHVRTLSNPQLRTLGGESLRNLFLDVMSEDDLLLAVEFPLRGACFPPSFLCYSVSHQ